MAEDQLPDVPDDELLGYRDHGRQYRETGGKCPYCHAESGAVKDEAKSEKFCKYCLTVIDKENIRAIHDDPEQDRWDRWFSLRREVVNDSSGPDRVKCAGGYASSYVFEEDFS